MHTETAMIAKAIRSEVRTAIKAGTVKLPAGARASVRSEQFSGGASVDVIIVGASEDWALAENDLGARVISPAARKLAGKFEAILRRHLTWQWGGVTTDRGLVLGSVAKRGWSPGQD